mmetsp:Transcript_35857/g.91605  ORF Transcript_35857/g.91605 Transcript_35857/m.91605 type:complete len:265 (+) Transcript_35857:442-1236(+)
MLGGAAEESCEEQGRGASAKVAAPRLQVQGVPGVGRPGERTNVTGIALLEAPGVHGHGGALEFRGRGHCLLGAPAQGALDRARGAPAADAGCRLRPVGLASVDWPGRGAWAHRLQRWGPSRVGLLARRREDGDKPQEVPGPQFHALPLLGPRLPPPREHLFTRGLAAPRRQHGSSLVLCAPDGVCPWPGDLSRRLRVLWVHHVTGRHAHPRGQERPLPLVRRLGGAPLALRVFGAPLPARQVLHHLFPFCILHRTAAASRCNLC